MPPPTSMSPCTLTLRATMDSTFSPNPLSAHEYACGSVTKGSNTYSVTTYLNHLRDTGLYTYVFKPTASA